MKRLVLGLILFLGSSAPVNAEVLTYFQETGGAGGSPRFLFDFDTATGMSALRTPVPGVERFFAFDVRPSDGSVFAIAQSGGLWIIDVSTGTPSFVGNTGIGETAGIAFNPVTESLFVLLSSGVLFSVNPETAASTFIGGTLSVERGISFSPAGQLFGFGPLGALYRIDPATGGTTFVGSLGFPITSIAEDSTFTPTGLLFLNDFSGNILQVDPATGNRTLVGTTSGPGLLGLFVMPVDTGTAIPEPSAFSLLSLGIFGLHVWNRRRRRAVVNREPTDRRAV